ncbi:hypothetical protein V8E36_008006 [Tilletia maclaganii]
MLLLLLGPKVKLLLLLLLLPRARIRSRSHERRLVRVQRLSSAAAARTDSGSDGDGRGAGARRYGRTHRSCSCSRCVRGVRVEPYACQRAVGWCTAWAGHGPLHLFGRIVVLESRAAVVGQNLR